MEKFEELEDWNDLQAAKASKAETRRAGGPIPWRTFKRELELRQQTNALHR
jgi:hypothetical protein